MKKARSEAFSDRAFNVETKGLEPSTSALRTHETRVLSVEQTGVTETVAKVSATVSPNERNTDVEMVESSFAGSDFAAALLMIERLPLSDERKAEAIRRLLASSKPDGI